MKEKSPIVNFFFFIWLAALIATPFFANYCYHSNFDTNTPISRSILTITNISPKVNFSGSSAPSLHILLGVAVWWIGVTAIPIFGIPIIFKFLGKSKNLNKLKENEGVSPRTIIKRRILFISLETIVIYWIYIDYIRGDSIIIASAQSAMMLSFATAGSIAAAILLATGLIIDYLNSRQS